MSAPTKTLAIAASLGVIALASLTIAGPLNPPAGAVQSTYKTLSEVEPRVALSQATAPGNNEILYIITQPGSYYLTGNVTCGAYQNFVRIMASDVTLDLGGFTVRAAGVQPGAEGVEVGSGDDNDPVDIVVKNGSITGFAHTQASGSDRCEMRDLRVRGIGEGWGIAVSFASRVVGCTAANVENGITASSGSVIESCRVSETYDVGIGSVGATVTDCSVYRGTGYGIYAQGGANVTRNDVTNGTGASIGIYIIGSGTRVENNTVRGGQWGVLLGSSATRNLIVGNRVQKGAGSAYAMSGQAAGNFPNNSVGQILANPASPVATTNPLANLEH